MTFKKRLMSRTLMSRTLNQSQHFPSCQNCGNVFLVGDIFYSTHNSRCNKRYCEKCAREKNLI